MGRCWTWLVLLLLGQVWPQAQAWQRGQVQVQTWQQGQQLSWREQLLGLELELLQVQPSLAQVRQLSWLELFSWQVQLS